MEIMKYTPPVSWEDKGLDWGNPDPYNIDYIAAIIEALKERIPREYIYENALQYFPGRPFSLTLLKNISSWITSVDGMGQYLNIQNLPDTLSAFPQEWTMSTFLNDVGDDFVVLPPPGSSAKQASAWLKAAYKAIRLLRYRNVSYKLLGYYRGSGSVWFSSSGEDLTAEECYSNCLAQAKSKFSGDWTTEGIHDGFVLQMYFYYEEGYRNPDSADLNPYFGKMEINTASIILSPTSQGIIAPEYTIYGRLEPLVEGGVYNQGAYYNQNAGYVNIYDAEQVYPNNHELGGIIKISDFTKIGKTLDLRPAYNKLPTIPSHSRMALGNSSGLHDIREMYQGFHVEELHLLGDYNSLFMFKS